MEISTVLRKKNQRNDKTQKNKDGIRMEKTNTDYKRRTWKIEAKLFQDAQILTAVRMAILIFLTVSQNKLNEFFSNFMFVF